VTKQLSITLDDALDAEVRAAAAGNISEWMAAAARERLTRQLWERYKATADALGINDPDWMAAEVAAREGSRASR
jgi:hypothetical protein